MPLTNSLKTLTSVALLGLSLPALAYDGPEIQHWTATNGARVFFVESRALPIVDVRIDFSAGAAYDPVAKAGLSDLTLSLLQSGSEGLDEQQISEMIADSGAIIASSSDNDRGGMSIRTLSNRQERDTAMTLAARVLAHPSFPAEALERERANYIAALRDNLTRPGTLAKRHFFSTLYGDHPYGRLVSPTTLSAISRNDLLAFHRRYFIASNCTISIVGDVSRSEAAQIAQLLTRQLPTGEAPRSLPNPSLPKRSFEHIPNPSSQTHIVAGMPVMSYRDPDYFPLLVGNYVLGGGGFVSRLTSEVREKRGLTYGVRSYFSLANVASPFMISLTTRGSQSKTALDVVELVLTDFIAQGPTPDELKAAHDNLVNGFGLRLDSNRKILENVAAIGFYGRPLDWLNNFTAEVEKVTAEQIRDAFSRRVKPENMVVIAVGGDGDSAPTAEKHKN